MFYLASDQLTLLLARRCIFKGNDKIVTRKFERAKFNSIFHTDVCIFSQKYKNIELFLLLTEKCD